MTERLVLLAVFAAVVTVIVPLCPAQTNELPLPKVRALSDGPEAAYDDIEMLTEIMINVKRYYVKDKTYKEITYGALHGLLEALDSHSSFLEPESYSDMQEETSGKFSGIGIHIGLKDGILTVIAPIEDTPAFKAGLQAGDRIVEIDGEKTMNITLKDAVKKLRGKKGSKVTITLGRAGREGPFEVSMLRDDIEVPSVKGTRVLGEGVGYVRITQFTQPTATTLQTALDTLVSNKIEGLVLDLRSNPGGLLKGAVEVAEKFLLPDTLVVYTEGRPGVQPRQEFRSHGKHHFMDFPMVVLVDGGSASASEIVAGALQDNKRAILIGATTYGKGSVQSVIQLKSEPKAAIRLTTSLYYTPSGRQINEKGIEPDIPVGISADEWRRAVIRRGHIENPTYYSDDEKRQYADAVDRQLARAYDLLLALKAIKKK